MKKTVSLLCIKTKSGAHKQLTFYFQIWKYFCRHLHSSLISMASTDCPFGQMFFGEETGRPKNWQRLRSSKSKTQQRWEWKFLASTQDILAACVAQRNTPTPLSLSEQNLARFTVDCWLRSMYTISIFIRQNKCRRNGKIKKCFFGASMGRFFFDKFEPLNCQDETVKF